MHRYPLRRGLIALASTLLTCAVGYGIASAAPTPVGAPTTAPKAKPAPKPAPRQGRLSWQLSPMQTYFTNTKIGSFTVPKSTIGQNYPTVATRLGWQIGYDVAPRATIYWNRTPNDSFQSLVAPATSGSPGLDLIDEIGATYRLARNWTVSAESYRRWRQCCPGAGDPTTTNPVISHGWSVITSAQFGPNTIIGKPLSVTYQGIDFQHPFTNTPAIATGQKLIGVSNEGTKWTSSETVALRIPVFHQRKFVPFVSVQTLPTYFQSSVEPIYSNAVNYGANIVGSPLVTYTFSVRNLDEHQEGYPFPAPNVQHYSWLIVSANFHGRLF